MAGELEVPEGAGSTLSALSFPAFHRSCRRKLISLFALSYPGFFSTIHSLRSLAAQHLIRRIALPAKLQK